MPVKNSNQSLLLLPKTFQIAVVHQKDKVSRLVPKAMKLDVYFADRETSLDQKGTHLK